MANSIVKPGLLTFIQEWLTYDGHTQGVVLSLMNGGFKAAPEDSKHQTYTIVAICTGNAICNCVGGGVLYVCVCVGLCVCVRVCVCVCV
jgi:hypothetical protein